MAQLTVSDVRRLAAEEMKRRGKANGAFLDEKTGACCMMGAIRIVIFGSGYISPLSVKKEQILLYDETLAAVNGDIPGAKGSVSHSVDIGKFNDTHSQDEAIRMLAGSQEV